MATTNMPLRILSLDGGGIRGISSLLILEDIMAKIRDAEGLDRVPRPCEYFDFIGGTSTGGIIATMLGRLGMVVDECIRAYRKVAQQAFTPKRTTILPVSPSGAFSAKALEAAIKRTVRDFCVQPECVARRAQGPTPREACPHGEMTFRDGSCTKTVVLAITKDNVDARPTLFATYDTSAALIGCTIWEVARATSAATTFFKPIRVGRDGIEFVDAGFGYNNPCEVLIEQARRQFPEGRAMRVLSIGTGLGGVVAIGNTRMSIISALKKIATSSKRVAASLADRYGESGQYYRFNVDQGLQDITLSDWEKASTISAHTRNYLRDKQRAIKNFVDNFTKAGFEGDNGETPPASTQHERAPVVLEGSGTSSRFLVPYTSNPHFLGRSGIFDQLKDQLGHGHGQTTGTAQHRTALYGLGGVGKTQVALAYAYWLQQARPEISVFWIYASSAERFRQAYVSIAKQCRIPGHDDPEVDVLTLVKRWLEGKDRGRWLMIIDNADDTQVFFGGPIGPATADTSILEGEVGSYIPDCAHGSVLVTTRNKETGSRLAHGKRPIELEDEDLDRDELLVLSAQLEYLPLALVQAAAFIQENSISVSEYLRLLGQSDQQLVDLLSEEFETVGRDSETSRAVTETWILSFEQIQRQNIFASQLLSLMSLFDRQAIPLVFLSHYGKQQQDQEPRGKIQLTKALGVLKAFLFVAEDKGHGFDMHRLVQLVTRKWLDTKGTIRQFARRAILTVSHNYPHDNHENREICGAFLAHVRAVLKLEGTGSRDERWATALMLHRAAGYFDYQAQWKDAGGFLMHAIKVWSELLGEEHPNTLTSMDNLALTYLNQGRWKEAESLQVQVVEARMRVPGEKHPNTLTSMSNLASTYWNQGRWKEASR